MYIFNSFHSGGTWNILQLFCFHRVHQETLNTRLPLTSATTVGHSQRAQTLNGMLKLHRRQSQEQKPGPATQRIHLKKVNWSGKLFCWVVLGYGILIHLESFMGRWKKHNIGIDAHKSRRPQPSISHLNCIINKNLINGYQLPRNSSTSRIAFKATAFNMSSSNLIHESKHMQLVGWHSRRTPNSPLVFFDEIHHKTDTV